LSVQLQAIDPIIPLVRNLSALSVKEGFPTSGNDKHNKEDSPRAELEEFRLNKRKGNNGKK
jgi:hypothetical protein